LFGGLWAEASRSDLALLRRAIRENWAVPLERRGTILSEVFALMKIAARAGNPGKVIAGARVCMEAAEYNMALERAERRGIKNG
jgi:hypothetical protein